ncbi:hypothetical protein BU23DRAFT_565888 [Bimuria novae-zelandiae CBS 107.79]|uniref:Ubiquitin 3 binding protein But2 C-terminal domain-containing protein n=1 Tax=Bimuria novae-zelandiae CBS 107.79 TaxID=1447943 RepID=A0A6A5VHN8_9PLEO|nr:hypothetical protein BU23DRAFT_565888 [Bimuria novae-zelandiae CBS 107.79]
MKLSIAALTSIVTVSQRTPSLSKRWPYLTPSYLTPTYTHIYHANSLPHFVPSSTGLINTTSSISTIHSFRIPFGWSGRIELRFYYALTNAVPAHTTSLQIFNTTRYPIEGTASNDTDNISTHIGTLTVVHGGDAIEAAGSPQDYRGYCIDRNLPGQRDFTFSFQVVGVPDAGIEYDTRDSGMYLRLLGGACVP